ncbi:MAG: 23S rRNA (guanosine(2251)-2'-O)-methyltransferase RlmB [Acidimicrobiaceae bacterium]|nr:23S rRNA (guanosine(2251)-2'-O)-methyltransferase RlmB [Acidimicrobiaceae bacterium]MYD06969.1 23S rRNA (guanosine(2251)-2'-O)-methyltransferase RlmB [Acidimicrobiaceae bacterium]MYI58333.1 23S rRNA (guanosine(2251)-2'-O)-methyltransferase RlmB [Acidimicrobiaceae bacterium]
MSRNRNSGGNRRRGSQGGGSSGGAKGKRRSSPSRGPSRRPPGQRGTTPRRDDPMNRSRGPSLGGDQVEGRHAVRELLLAGTRRTREVVFAGDLDDAPILGDIIDLADENKVPIRELPRSKFESMARTGASQGVLATAAPLQPAELEDLLSNGAGVDQPFLLLLDGITDPQNLGAILRTAECAGVTGVVLPRHRAAHITPSVTKAAAGAIEHLRIALVGGLPTAMQTLSAAGVWTVGLDSSGDQPIHRLTVADEPIALVLGAEGPGLSRLVRQRCDALASIPLQGALGSLNVSAAAAVACFEILSRRSQRPSE